MWWGFGKKSTDLPDDQVRKVLAAIQAKIRSGSSDTLRSMIAAELGPSVSGDSHPVTKLISDIGIYAVPEDAKKRGVDFHTWWDGASLADRANGIETATAWLTSH